MQNIISKLQDIIRTHYGYTSELEWTPGLSFQNLLKETYSPIDKTLSIPIYEPKSGRPLAYFKVLNVAQEHEVAREKLRDLVHLSLQSYVNLMDQLEVSDNLIQYLQIELNPQKILRFQQQGKQVVPVPEENENSDETEDEEEDFDLSFDKEALLLKSNSPLKLERLALSLHAAQKNHFFLRTDHMPVDFLNSLNDLAGLVKTTIYIPHLELLTPRQQKTLETYFLMRKASPTPDLLLIAATQLSLGELVHNEGIHNSFLKHFDFFYVLSESAGESEIQFESLNQCAQAILQSESTQQLKHHKFASYTKSCHLIPSCQSLFPTIH